MYAEIIEAIETYNCNIMHAITIASVINISCKQSEENTLLGEDITCMHSKITSNCTQLFYIYNKSGLARESDSQVLHIMYFLIEH